MLIEMNEEEIYSIFQIAKIFVKDCLKENLYLKSLFYRQSLSFMKRFYFS